MKKGNDREREEKLLQAIGNLPEDMLAKAAEYRRPAWRGRRYLLRGLAAAACLALVILGGAKGISRLKASQETADRAMMSAQSGRQPAEEKSILDQQDTYGSRDSEAEADANSGGKGVDATQDIASGSIADGSAAAGMQIWVAGAEVQKENEKGKKAGSGSQGTGGFDADDPDSNDGDELRTVLERGKTVSLRLTKTEDRDGEEISVVTIGFAETEKETAYMLHSQTSNCKIVSVSHKGLTKFIDLPDAECVSGDMVEFDTRQYASADWEYNLVPEWKTINIIDIIDISRKGEIGEEDKAGRIVIGKAIDKEKYYAIYQNTND